MKEKQDIILKVTSDEEELIKAVRNYCNSYPELLDYAQDIFDRMTDMPR